MLENTNIAEGVKIIKDSNVIKPLTYATNNLLNCETKAAITAPTNGKSTTNGKLNLNISTLIKIFIPFFYLAYNLYLNNTYFLI